MTMKRLLRRLWTLPESATDEEIERELWRALSVRLVLGGLVLVGWIWFRWTVLASLPHGWFLGRIGLWAIGLTTGYPLIRLSLMDDQDFDQLLEDSFPEGIPDIPEGG